MTSFIVRAFPNQRDDFRYTIYQTVRGISVQKEQLIRGSRNRFHSIVVFQKSFVELDAIDVQADIAETCTLDACTEKIRDESVSWLYHLIRKEDQLETFGKYLFREMKLRKLMELNNISSYKLDQTYIEGTRLGNLSIAIIFDTYQLHLHSGDDKTLIANMTFGNVQVTLDSEVLTRSLHCPVEGNLKSSELSSEASTLLEPAYEPMPWKEVWHFRPNVGTDTFLFEIGSFDHPHQSGNGKNSKQGSGVSHSSTEK